MTSPPDILKAIRSGKLSEVIAALDTGACIELNDGQGDPGLPLAMACFMGHAEIVRELVLRGAKANFADNSVPNSPLAMALRGKRSEVVKVLIELGVDIPPGTETGLSEQELIVARWKAQHFSASQAGSTEEQAIEEIRLDSGCYGTDTSVLEADVLRYARTLDDKK